MNSQFEQLHALVGVEHQGLVNSVVTAAYLTGRGGAFADVHAGRVIAEGYWRGYSDAVADLAAAQREQVRIAREAAQGIDYADLCDLRGDHDRASQARAHQQRIDAMPSPTEVGGWVA